MKKIYISSTYQDLIDHRHAVSKALRKIRYDVIRMEEYVARDQRTRAACERDVAECDIYVGIFAWRYGHIPEDDNDERLSITELEYRAAEEKTRLVFLLRDEAPWPSTMRDAETGEETGGKRMRDLRARLKEHCAGYFSTPDELAMEVIAAVVHDESTKLVRQLDLLDEIKNTTHLGPSYLPNIQHRIIAAGEAEIVEISLGPTPWWTTRLHLVSALASDFTRIQQFVFLDGEGNYLMMAPPIEVRRALTRRFPRLEQVYLASFPKDTVEAAAPEEEIERIIVAYQYQIFEAYDGIDEADVKQDVSPLMLTRDLGIQSSAETVEHRLDQQRLMNREILRRQSPFVVLVDDGKLTSVIDRVRMASKIAAQALPELG